MRSVFYVFSALLLFPLCLLVAQRSTTTPAHVQRTAPSPPANSCAQIKRAASFSGPFSVAALSLFKNPLRLDLQNSLAAAAANLPAAYPAQIQGGRKFRKQCGTI